jgi:glycosyltransferase involved in cell wall biosynthesis
MRNLLKYEKLREKLSFVYQKNAKVFVFTSQYITNKRKWLDLLLPFFQLNNLINTYYSIVGSNSPKLGSKDNIMYTSYIYNDRLMVLVDSDEDYFILPLRKDNFPNTMLVSIAYGNPVISFPICDTKELLEDSKCGVLVDDISSFSFIKK